MNKPDPIPTRLAALKATPTPELKAQWRDLFDCEPPPFNRRYLDPGWPIASRNSPMAG